MSDYSFQRILTSADIKQHLAHVFHVPEGVARIVIDMVYSPAGAGNLDNHLVITVFDPVTSRGSRHYPGDREGNARKHHIEIAASHASYGFIFGPIPGGEWNATVHTNMVLPDTLVSYVMTVRLLLADDAQDPDAEPNMPVQAFAPRQGPAWFRGDLHAHTYHSDGNWDVPDLIAEARARKLDFVTLSDHNTASALRQMRALARPALLTMGAIELTTFHGHALALGERVTDWIDWRSTPERGMPQIAAEIAAVDGIFVIAHPMSDGDPICTGCDWRYADMLPGNARHVEIWNSGLWTHSHNEAALELFYSWLNAGNKLVVTAGTDTHGPGSLEIQAGFNVVYAQSLTERDIVHAIQLGHLYLSTGPVLTLTARDNTSGKHVMMGDTLAAGTVEVTVAWDSAAPGDKLQLILQGKAYALDFAPSGSATQTLRIEKPIWITAELRDAAGLMRAITNPIFLHNGNA
jgi:hypothetical protein